MINLVIPNASLSYSADDFYLQPGEKYTTPYSSKIYPPFGNEIMKLVASKQPIDFSEVIVGQGATTRSNNQLNEIEKILVGLYGETRGQTVIYSDNDISVSSLTFLIE